MQANLHFNNSNQFNKYSDNSVTVNETEHTNNLIVTRSVTKTLEINNIQDLTLEYIDELVKTYSPEIIIFGTGTRITMPHHDILLKLQRQHIGFEVMPIPALCRTFNYLSGEDRNVVALIIF